MSLAVQATRLEARSLVEASAGTGKTWTLAGLFARAVVVERFRVPEVLAVTYTVAATQELHERVRLRLQRAAALAAEWREDDPAAREGDGADVALLRGLLHAALADGESLPALRLRLQRALRDLDLAAIHTIHGFCQRALREHALDTAQPLAAAELEAGSRARNAALAVDLWRAWSRDAEGAAFLRRRFASPDALARRLPDLLAHEPLLPPPPAPVAQSEGVFRAAAMAGAALRDAFVRHGGAARRAIEDAVEQKVLSRDLKKGVPVEALWEWLAALPPEGGQAPHPLAIRITPDYLATLCLKGKADRVPRSPLFEQAARYQAACAAAELQRHHALRADAQRRDAVRKRDFNVCAYDDLIGRLHVATRDPQRGPALCAALRARFPRVLVDEFQDTDARQWQIFSALFGNGGLVLVGDPKQAIYRFRGGDVATYVTAAGGAERAPRLEFNFRSRPCLIQAVNRMFADMPVAALGDGIDFAATAPGGGVADGDYRLEGAPAPAIAFHQVPPRHDGKPYTKPQSVQLVAQLCAEHIRDRLLQACAGAALIRDRDTGELRPLQPRDIAVLVREHAQGDAVRAALAARGVAAVASGNDSLYASSEARDLLTLLQALHAPGDDRRLRAALATPLFGWDAARLQALGDDGDALQAWLQRLSDWRMRWQRHGPAALVSEVVAGQAAHVLAHVGGERRLTNLLQLGELLQGLGARSLGMQGQLDALRAGMANPDAEDEAQQLRLESDAGRVQILTLHKSKGLEFPLVYLPFAMIGRQAKMNATAMYTRDGRRVRQIETCDALAGGGATWDEARALHLAEDAAEDMRLLYVGLTRARAALWACTGALSQHASTALHRLLGGIAPGDRLRAALAGAATFSAEPPPQDTLRRLPVAAIDAVPPVREAGRRLTRDWWIHSFSQLHRQRAQGVSALLEDAAADDEAADAGRAPADVAADAPADDLRFGGTRFGNALHHVLEHAAAPAWVDHRGDAAPVGQEALLAAALSGQGYVGEELLAGQRALAPLVARTLNAPLPEGGRLCDLAPADARHELEFHFALAGASTASLLALLQQHGIALGRRDFGAWTRLAGLMTGKIDLVYRRDQRLYVVDYKSNRLPDYGPDALAQAMAASEYDVQALLYVLALHRWLRLRLPAYDYDVHVGGVRYLFSRGLDPRDPTRGLHARMFRRALVEALDTLLTPSPGVAA